MRVLPNRELSKEEYRTLDNWREHCNPYSKFVGGEGIVIPNTSLNIATKLFFENEDGYENKLKKLNWLYQEQQKREEKFPIRILSSVSYKGEFIAYDMTYDEKDESFSTICLLKEEKIDCLKEVVENLKFYHSLGIVYGDVSSNNISVNRKTLKTGFFDLDNIQIANLYPIDLIPKEWDGFIKESFIKKK